MGSIHNSVPDFNHSYPYKGIREEHSTKAPVAITNHDHHSRYEGRSLADDEQGEEGGNIDLSYDRLDMEKEAQNLVSRFASNPFSNTPATYDYYEDNYQEVHIY